MVKEYESLFLRNPLSILYGSAMPSSSSLMLNRIVQSSPTFRRSRNLYFTPTPTGMFIVKASPPYVNPNPNWMYGVNLFVPLYPFPVPYPQKLNSY